MSIGVGLGVVLTSVLLRVVLTLIVDVVIALKGLGVLRSKNKNKKFGLIICRFIS